MPGNAERVRRQACRSWRTLQAAGQPLIAGTVLPLRASKSIWRPVEGDENGSERGLRPRPYSVFLHESCPYPSAPLERPTRPGGVRTCSVWSAAARPRSAACTPRSHPEPRDSVVGLSVDQINRRFAAACAATGLEVRRTSHGGRVGLAVELTASGASHPRHPARRRLEGPRHGGPLRREYQHARRSRQQVPALIRPMWARFVRPVLHLGDLGVRVLRMRPIVVGALLRSLPVQTRQLVPDRRQLQPGQPAGQRVMVHAGHPRNARGPGRRPRQLPSAAPSQPIQAPDGACSTPTPSTRSLTDGEF